MEFAATTTRSPPSRTTGFGAFAASERATSIAVARRMPQATLRAVILVIGILVTALYFAKNYR